MHDLHLVFLLSSSVQSLPFLNYAVSTAPAAGGSLAAAQKLRIFQEKK